MNNLQKAIIIIQIPLYQALSRLCCADMATNGVANGNGYENGHQNAMNGNGNADPGELG